MRQFKAMKKPPAFLTGVWTVVGPPGLEPGTKGLLAASRIKSMGYKRSKMVWKQMWKQGLVTSTKLRTVNQRFCGRLHRFNS
jgi:hypothetical protein